MKSNINIAVDGTAGSGKSTVMRIIAEKFGFDFIDTGLMYRAYTKLCLENKIDFSNNQDILSIIPKFDCDYDKAGDILIGKINYTKFAEDYDVAEHVRFVAAIPEVREIMVKIQQAIGAKKNKIMVGRDITTVVLPDAELKIYFDSSPEARAHRRFKQNEEHQIQPNNYEDILRQIIQRDEWDQKRSVGALKVAVDAWYIDTTSSSIEEVVDNVSKKIKSIV